MNAQASLGGHGIFEDSQPSLSLLASQSPVASDGVLTTDSNEHSYCASQPDLSKQNEKPVQLSTYVSKMPQLLMNTLIVMDMTHLRYLQKKTLNLQHV